MAPKVKLYALSTCIHCTRAKEYLDKGNYEYDCTYVDKLDGEARQQAINEIKRYNPSLSFPTMIIGEKVVIGFDKAELQAALGS